jgi:phosphoribosyl 1,2-cyclic phosphodiesterase
VESSAADGKRFLQICMLASGSSGNACYVESAHCRILVDAGLSGREISRRFEKAEIDIEGLDAIFLTHEHGDHIRGAGPLSRRLGIPVYLTEGTLERGGKTLGKLPKPIVIQTGEAVRVKDISVETFTKCHDASDPLGLVCCSNGKRLGIATDLGRSTRVVEEHLRSCQALVLEFNHDPVMLDQGPYSLDLKKRIRSAEGHLSNEQAAHLLGMVGHPDLRHLVLAHLSEINNNPEKAYATAVEALERLGLQNVRVSVAMQHEPGTVIKI